MKDRFYSNTGTATTCALCMRLPNPNPVLDKILHPWVQRLYPALGLGPGGRLQGHFQTPVLCWTNCCLLRKLLPATRVIFGALRAQSWKKSSSSTRVRKLVPRAERPRAQKVENRVEKESEVGESFDFGSFGNR